VLRKREERLKANWERKEEFLIESIMRGITQNTLLILQANMLAVCNWIETENEQTKLTWTTSNRNNYNSLLKLHKLRSANAPSLSQRHEYLNYTSTWTYLK
jgi:hypothetical protein